MRLRNFIEPYSAEAEDNAAFAGDAAGRWDGFVEGPATMFTTGACTTFPQLLKARKNLPIPRVKHIPGTSDFCSCVISQSADNKADFGLVETIWVATFALLEGLGQPLGFRSNLALAGLSRCRKHGASATCAFPL